MILLVRNFDKNEEENNESDVEEIDNAIFIWCVIFYVSLATLTKKIDFYNQISTIIFMCIILVFKK